MSGRTSTATLSGFVREPLVALELMTLLSLGRPRLVDPGALGRSQAYFPAVGLLLGAIVFGLHEALPAGVGPSLAGWLLAGSLALLTRGFHLDGLADTFDGLGGGRSAEERLRIMRDSAIGAFGAVALVVVIGVKATSIGSLPPGEALTALLLAPAAARWGAVATMAAFPYARVEGLGLAFHATSLYRPLLTAAATVAVAGYLLAGAEGMALLAGLTLGALACGWLLSRALGGGLSGDSYGAVIEIGETAAFAAFAAGLGA